MASQENSSETEKQERPLFANVKGGVFYSQQVEIPLELQKRLEQIAEERATGEVHTLLPETVKDEMENAGYLSKLDSTAIGAMTCALVSAGAGLLGVQLAVAGNFAVASALGWVALTGTVGLAILLYARAS